MANSSRARAVNKQNTAVLYYEPSENVNDTPVSTARVVGVGAVTAAHGGSGATLQLVGRMLEGAPPDAPGSAQPQVVQVEPPRAAARQRPVDKRPTRVIAYNVHIVASADQEAADEPQVVSAPNQAEVPEDTQYWETGADEPAPRVPRSPAEEQYDIRGRSHRHREQELELIEHVQRGPVDSQFVLPNRGQRAAQNEQFRAAAMNVPMPGAALPDMPRDRIPFAVPAGMRNARGQIPMSVFGALEGMGAQAVSYKQLLAQHWAAGAGGAHGHGPLLSNRNLCIAVGAYALILFLLALFTG